MKHDSGQYTGTLILTSEAVYWAGTSAWIYGTGPVSGLAATTIRAPRSPGLFTPPCLGRALAFTPCVYLPLKFAPYLYISCIHYVKAFLLLFEVVIAALLHFLDAARHNYVGTKCGIFGKLLKKIPTCVRCLGKVTECCLGVAEAIASKVDKHDLKQEPINFYYTAMDYSSFSKIARMCITCIHRLVLNRYWT